MRQHCREYRFDVRYRAGTGVGLAALERQIVQGFPFLTSGSQLVLDQVAQQIVLEQLRLPRKGLATEVRSYGDLPLAGFLAESRHDLVDIDQVNSSLTDVRRLAGLPTATGGPGEAPLLRRLSSLLPRLAAVSPRKQRFGNVALPAGQPCIRGLESCSDS